MNEESHYRIRNLLQKEMFNGRENESKKIKRNENLMKINNCKVSGIYYMNCKEIHSYQDLSDPLW
jgi:hypothetical protein